MCMIDNENPASVSSQRDQKARKEHKCSECCRVIHPGERYRSYWGVWDGSAETYKHCAHCLVLCKWLQINCHGYLFQGVVEDISEHGRDYDRRDLYELAMAANSKWMLIDELLPVPAMPKPIGKESFA